MVPQNTEKKSALRTNPTLKLDSSRKNFFTSNHWDVFQLNSLNTNDEKPKITTTTLAFGKIWGSAISMVSEESDW